MQTTTYLPRINLPELSAFQPRQSEVPLRDQQGALREDVVLTLFRELVQRQPPGEETLSTVRTLFSEYSDGLGLSYAERQRCFDQYIRN